MLILELKLWVLNESFRQCNIRTHQVCRLLEQISDVVLWSSCTCKYMNVLVLVTFYFYQLNFGGHLVYFLQMAFYFTLCFGGLHYTAQVRWVYTVTMCVTLWVLSPP